MHVQIQSHNRSDRYHLSSFMLSLFELYSHDLVAMYCSVNLFVENFDIVTKIRGIILGWSPCSVP